MDGQNFQNDNYQDYTANVQAQPAAEQPQEQNNTLAVVSLVLGIVSIITACCCGIGFVLGIAGIICAVLANKKNKSGIGTAGLICSIIGTVFGVFGIIYWIYCFAVSADILMNEVGYYY